MAPKSAADNFLKLPVSVASSIDVGRLLRETENIANFMDQASIRQPGTALKLPRTSRLFDEITTNNQLNALREEDRQRLTSFLQEVKAHAPVVHMSFSADPSPLFIQRLISWLRAEIHPLVLLQIGLQPNMGAGCVVRTTNKYFDFSLRSRLKQSAPQLSLLLKGSTG